MYSLTNVHSEIGYTKQLKLPLESAIGFFALFSQLFAILFYGKSP